MLHNRLTLPDSNTANLMSDKQITSTQNPYIKELVLLKEKSKARKRSGLFLIEGLREITLAIKGGYELEAILIYPELISEDQIHNLTKDDIKRIEVSKDVYQKLAYRETTEGIIAVAKIKDISLSAIKLNAENP